MEGEFLYVTNYTGSLDVFDVSDLEDPRFVGACLSFVGDPYHLAVVGPRAYVRSDDSGMYVCDISDPTSPRISSYFPGVEGYMESIDADSRLVVLSNAYGQGITVLPADCAGAAVPVMDDPPRPLALDLHPNPSTRAPPLRSRCPRRNTCG